MGWESYVAVSPLSGFKTSFYEGGTRPPLIIKEAQVSSSSPSNNSNTNFVKSFVYVTDITPTILEFANV
jgi:arylsulfatase A-like enzyme